MTEVAPHHRSPVWGSAERGVKQEFWLVHRDYYEDIYSAPEEDVYKYNRFAPIFALWKQKFRKSPYNIHYLEDGVPIQVAMIHMSGDWFSGNKFAMKWYDGLNSKYSASTK